MLALVLGWTQCLPQGVGGVGGYNLHSVPPNSPPDCGTVAHQPRAGCIRLVLSRLYPFGAPLTHHHHNQHTTFSSVILQISVFTDCVVPLSKYCLNITLV